MAGLPDADRMIILARSNGIEELPQDVLDLVASRDPAIDVQVDVPRSEALGHVARASVLIYTLSPDSVMGYPMSIIEAMLCGTIVIAPDRPEAHAIVGEHLRTYVTVDDIIGHVADVSAGGPDVAAARQALRHRAQRYRAQAERQRLHDELRDGLTAWRLRQE
jgi:glycosyltransferase involved in cell wall biosynthesis